MNEFSVSSVSPSNIAIVKYWGKHGNQLPNNPSISFTLSRCHTETFVKAYLIDNDLVFSYELFVHGIVLHDNEFLHTIMKLLIPISDNFFNEEEVRNLFHFIWEYYDVVDIRDIDLSQYPKSRKKY